MEYAAIALGFAQAWGGIWGAGKQKDVDKAQVELAYKDNLEKIRRREFEQEQTKGAAKAFSETAGVLHSGGSTAQGVLDTMAREFKTELDWMVKFGTEARRIGHKAASVRAKTSIFSSLTGGAQTGASLYSAYS
ncbi:MAG: hypothetical protein KAS38_02685 [Anaerolineales bacterium]|nr:hypothetical protein [Anaerolineales bacterium]